MQQTDRQTDRHAHFGVIATGFDVSFRTLNRFRTDQDPFVAKLHVGLHKWSLASVNKVPILSHIVNERH